MSYLVVYLFASALLALILLVFMTSEPNCDCEQCQHPDAVENRRLLQRLMARLNFWQSGILVFVLSLVTLPLCVIFAGFATAAFVTQKI